MMRDVHADFDLGTQGEDETDLERSLKIANRVTSSNFSSVPVDTLIFALWTLARSVVDARRVGSQRYCTCNMAKDDSRVLDEVLEALQVKSPAQGEDAGRRVLRPIHTPPDVVSVPKLEVGYVVYQEDWGIFMGTVCGETRWSKLNPIEDLGAMAAVFHTVERAHGYMQELSPPVENYQTVEVKNPRYFMGVYWATSDDCAAAGLPGWQTVEAP